MQAAFSRIATRMGGLNTQSIPVACRATGVVKCTSLQRSLGQAYLFLGRPPARFMAFKETRATVLPKKQPKDMHPDQHGQPTSQHPIVPTDPSQHNQPLSAEEYRLQLQQQLQEEANKPVPISYLLKDAFVWGVGVTLAFAVVGALFR